MNILVGTWLNHLTEAMLISIHNIMLIHQHHLINCLKFKKKKKRKNLFLTSGNGSATYLRIHTPEGTVQIQHLSPPPTSQPVPTLNQ